MKKLTIIAAALLMTGSAAFAQNTTTTKTQVTEQDTVLDRTRWDKPTTKDVNSMKTEPGVGIQMDNGTRQDQREFKNTVDTPGRREKLPRRDR